MAPYLPNLLRISGSGLLVIVVRYRIKKFKICSKFVTPHEAIAYQMRCRTYHMSHITQILSMLGLCENSDNFILLMLLNAYHNLSTESHYLTRAYLVCPYVSAWNKIFNYGVNFLIGGRIVGFTEAIS